MDQQSNSYCSRSEGQADIPNQSMMNTNHLDFDVLMAQNDLASDNMRVGPPPSRIPRLEGALTIDVSRETNYPGSMFHSGPHSSPHSPMSDTHPKRYSSFTKKNYQKNGAKSSRSSMVRATSPVFPDQSTPLSSLTRQPSLSSVSSNRSADQLSVFSFSVKSDPGIYNPHSNGCESAMNSPSVSMGHGSPASFDFTTSKSMSSTLSSSSAAMESKTRSCLKLEMPSKYARRISDLDKKILKLQAERSKVLEKAHHTNASSIPDVSQIDMDSSTSSWILGEKTPDVGMVHLYIFPLGIHDLDEPLYDDASKLLRQVGGLYHDLQTSIDTLRSICCKGMFILAEISTCFAYIKSLLQRNQTLKLSNVEGVYSIQLCSEEDTKEGLILQEFTESLKAANNVLRFSQHITLSYTSVQMQLQKLHQIAAGKVESCDHILTKLGVGDRERRGQIRMVLEGNYITMASAQRVWPQYYHIATQTISTITECIHPVN